MIRYSILITTDPGIFCPDIPSFSSPPGLRLFQHLASGCHDPKLSRPGIPRLWLLPPDILCRCTIILISPSLHAVCPDRSLTFSILSLHSYIISRSPHDGSQTRGKLSQPCLRQSPSCALSILFFPSHPVTFTMRSPRCPRGVSLSLILLLVLRTPRFSFTFSYQHIAFKQIVFIN